MKRIIDIDEDLFNELLQGTASNRQNDKILKCVKNGKPLQEEEFFNYNSPNVLKSELEKIKEEINKKSVGIVESYRAKLFNDLVIDCDELNEIIDNHIKELKEK